MSELNSRCAKWDFGLDEDWGARRVFGHPQPQACVRHFLAVIE